MNTVRRLPLVGATALALAVLAALAVADDAHGAAPPLVYAVVVGNNDGLGMLPALRYADDDALRFYRLAVRLAPKQNVALLTDLDVDTWRRIQLASAQPPPYLTPTREKLLEVIRLFKRQIASARRADPSRQVHFYFFFSGHGEKGYFFLKKRQGPLARSAFTGTDLDRTFADSKATLNALFIDACKSQSLFLAKGPGGKDHELGPDFSGLINKLERTTAKASIGVITSTVSDKPAGEARDIRGGYFSHVLISGLRGAADANSDGVIRYGELAAFVSFHTRRIAGQRPWFRPPQGRLDTPLINLKHRRDLLVLPPGLAGHLAVFDAKGNNLILEVHKTTAQWTRLILSPGRYKVVWITSPTRGLAAEVDMTAGSQRLMLENFESTITLGQDRFPKGEGLGAPPPEEPHLVEDAAAVDFDPSRSGFDQPFTPRVVSALAVAYNSGRSTRPAVRAQPAAPSSSPRHFISAGYGMHSPPVEELTAGQGVSLGYFYRLRRAPIYLGLRGFYAFSSHVHVRTDQPFQLRRLMLQAEARYALPFGGRFEVSLGAYTGWQATMVTSKQEGSTVLTGDAAGFRAGVTGELHARIAGGLWASLNIAGGVDLAHQIDASSGVESSEAFLRPQAFAQVGYAF